MNAGAEHSKIGMNWAKYADRRMMSAYDQTYQSCVDSAGIEAGCKFEMNIADQM